MGRKVGGRASSTTNQFPPAFCGVGKSAVA